MTAFEEYINKRVNGESPDDDFPKNESSYDELFIFATRRVDQIVELRKENIQLRERIAQLEAAQQGVHPTAGTDPLKERLIVDDETLNNPDGWFTSGG